MGDNMGAESKGELVRQFMASVEPLSVAMADFVNALKPAPGTEDIEVLKSYLTGLVARSVAMGRPFVDMVMLFNLQYAIGRNLISGDDLSEIVNGAYESAIHAQEKIVTVEDVAKVEGKCLLHGKFGYLTEAHILTMNTAAQFGDLYIGVESDRRMLERFGIIPIYSERARLTMVAAQPVVKGVFLIEGSGDDEEFYMDLVVKIRPDIYFTSAEYPEKFQHQRRDRALAVGARLVILPCLNSASSSNYRKSLNIDML